MATIVSWIVNDILMEIREAFGFAFLSAILALLLYRFLKRPERLSAAHMTAFFCWVFYTAMLLFRTLLNRKRWPDPLNKFWEGWGFGAETTADAAEALENVFLFIPFIFLLFCSFWDCFYGKNVRAADVIRKAFKISILCSFGIEGLQLIFSLGTFQLADLTYNTLGGITGGVIFFVSRRGLKNEKQND